MYALIFFAIKVYYFPFIYVAMTCATVKIDFLPIITPDPEFSIILPSI